MSDFVRFDYVSGSSTFTALVKPGQVSYITDEGGGLSALHMLPDGILFVRMTPDEALRALGQERVDSLVERAAADRAAVAEERFAEQERHLIDSLAAGPVPRTAWVVGFMNKGKNIDWPEGTKKIRWNRYVLPNGSTVDYCIGREITRLCGGTPDFVLFAPTVPERAYREAKIRAERCGALVLCDPADVAA